MFKLLFSCLFISLSYSQWTNTIYFTDSDCSGAQVYHSVENSSCAPRERCVFDEDAQLYSMATCSEDKPSLEKRLSLRTLYYTGPFADGKCTEMYMDIQRIEGYVLDVCNSLKDGSGSQMYFEKDHEAMKRVCTDEDCAVGCVEESVPHGCAYHFGEGYFVVKVASAYDEFIAYILIGSCSSVIVTFIFVSFFCVKGCPLYNAQI
eukprot:TRINITY_DN137_c0_g1_i1.p1 TRINITY_DN137_c0_g1~~TRINITY_DN137_c0_g1_i1.p1  ORF type:complete len:213 (-),score=35.21 TRINITY_DN137_c0_g1_i1:24-638(-)